MAITDKFTLPGSSGPHSFDMKFYLEWTVHEQEQSLYKIRNIVYGM